MIWVRERYAVLEEANSGFISMNTENVLQKRLGLQVEENVLKPLLEKPHAFKPNIEKSLNYILFYKLGFTPCKTKQSLRGM